VSKQGCYSYLALLSHLINTHPCYIPFSFIMSDKELPPIVSSFKKTSLRRRGDFSNFNFTEHPRIAANISLVLGMKCYPSSTHNFTLEKRYRRKYRAENTSVRRFAIEFGEYSDEARRSPSEYLTRVGYVHLLSNSAKKNKVAFVRAELGTGEGGCDFLRILVDLQILDTR